MEVSLSKSQGSGRRSQLPGLGPRSQVPALSPRLRPRFGRLYVFICQAAGPRFKTQVPRLRSQIQIPGPRSENHLAGSFQSQSHTSNRSSHVSRPSFQIPNLKSQVPSLRRMLVPGRRSHGPSSKPQAQAPSSDAGLKRFSASRPNPQGPDLKTHVQVSQFSALRSQVQVPSPGPKANFLPTKS